MNKLVLKRRRFKAVHIDQSSLLVSTGPLKGVRGRLDDDFLVGIRIQLFTLNPLATETIRFHFTSHRRVDNNLRNRIKNR